MRQFCAASLLLVLLCTSPVFTQVKPLPPHRDFKPETRQSASGLPVLKLPEYVITGSDVAGFTEDKKDGINDPDEAGLLARAGRGTREKRFTTTLPIRLPLALAPIKGIRHVFGLKAGYGSFDTPSLEAWYADRFSNLDVGIEGNWEKSNGYVRLSDYEQGRLHAAIGSWLPGDILPFFSSSRIEGDFLIEGVSYGLFADNVLQQLPVLDFRRKGDHIHFRSSLISRKNPVFDHEISAFFASTTLREDILVSDTMEFGPWDQSELRAGIDATTKHDIEGLSVETRAQFHFGDLKPASSESSAPFYHSLGAGSRFALSEDFSLDAGLKLLYYRGTGENGNLRLYPSLRLSLRFNDDYVSWAAFEPEIREVTFDRLRRINPFLMLASELRHTDIPLHFTIGASYDNRRSTSGRIYAEYVSTSSWPRFDVLDEPVRRQWKMHYGSLSSVFSIHTELHHRFTRQTRIQVDLAFRSSYDEELKTSIPYLPGMEARALLSHDYPFGLHLEATIQFVGEQVTQDGSIPTWMLLGAGAEYRIFDAVGVFLNFSNILDDSYQRWRGYTERPLFVTGGLTVRL